MSAKKTEAPKSLISRAAAANTVVRQIDGQTTLNELVTLADQLVVESGGKSNFASQKEHVRRCLATAESFGLVKVTKPTDLLVTKTK